MKADNRVIDLTPDVKWIGVLDYDIRTFDIVMHTDHGTTYNSYFINAEKKAIIETAKEKFSDVFLSKLRQVTDPAELAYIVLDHTEPDHSGAMRQLLDLAPGAVVVGSGNTIRYLGDIVNRPFKSLVVKDGDTLDLGNKTLKFISAPNLHWPDSIYTYIVEDKILFTCDSFGAHYCHAELFDDLVGDYQADFRYYFDVILKPYSKFMVKAIEKIRPLEISMIAPGHGPVLRKNWKSIVDETRRLSEEYLALTERSGVKRVLITYVSAYGYTAEMARLIAEGASKAENLEVEVLDIETADIGLIDSKIAIADGIIVGSPTINQNTLLPVYNLMAVVSPLRDRGKLAGSFGSYGWSGEAPSMIAEMLKNLKLKYFEEPAAFKFVPEDGKDKTLIEYGERFGKALTSPV
ncbi:MAG TPA: FprA family A-type flavoprotein [Bacteroidales bacterium]|nr:FprA family A-type flavoprotein [Bacteroidales bacterium]MDI9533258.1 FprA family A-type flavoprotein [Bacteroidota bacterium]MBP7036376.1 FprA family A-type flavoprotein [Bacteroidales bacterium]MBP8710239.1 FprA family A-type flavoprotein [Bacteroidales bacterium]HNV66950.1 FprA family A-type flavoprotein [Bacteroidales bacterium]